MTSKNEHVWISPYIIPGENHCSCGYTGYTTSQGLCPNRNQGRKMINQLIELVPNSIKYLRLVTDGDKAVYLYASHDGLNFGLVQIIHPQPSEQWYDPSND